MSLSLSRVFQTLDLAAKIAKTPKIYTTHLYRHSKKIKTKLRAKTFLLLLSIFISNKFIFQKTQNSADLRYKFRYVDTQTRNATFDGAHCDECVVCCVDKIIHLF